MNSTELPASELIARHELNVYPKRGVTLVRGEGTRVWDADGNEYIDCAAGIGVANLGHCPPAVTAAITQQMQRLITCPNSFDNDQRAELYSRLAQIVPPPLSKFFLCNSGTEAVEAAIKLARLTTQRTQFVCAARGFHGRTCGALSATHNPKYRTPFEPLVPGFEFVPFNDAERLRDAVTDETAAVILEVVQGEGGVHVGDSEYFAVVREVCTQRGALLIIDEIQTGFCRTGRMFACEHFGIAPDIMCVAKAIAGGLPMGAVLCCEKIAAPTGLHGSTFGGNPLCCAAAIATIDTLLGDHLAEQAAGKGAYVRDKLLKTSLSKVREVRGLGLMIGIELRQRVQPILRELLAAGVIALPAGGLVLRLLPPLTISYAELDEVIAKLRVALA